VSEQTLRKWVFADQVEGGERDGVTSDERVELARRTYGYRRVTAKLVDGRRRPVGRHRVARLVAARFTPH
jgi:hypothetical protein